MGEVTAMIEAETHDGVALFKKCEVHAQIRVGTRVRLHIGVLGAEELLDAVACDVFDLVDDLVAAVVALAGIALGVLVGEN